MTTWRPASHEIDPLLEAVVNAARATILPVSAINSPAPLSNGVRDLVLADGRTLRLALKAHQVTQESRNDRPLVVYEIGGSAVVDRSGYRVIGKATVDLATRAFFDVDCRLEPVGIVGV
jgi:hypothetical protein